MVFFIKNSFEKNSLQLKNYNFCDVAKLVIIHKEYLAKFGYREIMKEKKESFYILSTC